MPWPWDSCLLKGIPILLHWWRTLASLCSALWCVSSKINYLLFFFFKLTVLLSWCHHALHLQYSMVIPKLIKNPQVPSNKIPDIMLEKNFLIQEIAGTCSYWRLLWRRTELPSYSRFSKLSHMQQKRAQYFFCQLLWYAWKSCPFYCWTSGGQSVFSEP